jgi:hypothetical protein
MTIGYEHGHPYQTSLMIFISKWLEKNQPMKLRLCCTSKRTTKHSRQKQNPA